MKRSMRITVNRLFALAITVCFLAVTTIQAQDRSPYLVSAKAGSIKVVSGRVTATHVRAAHTGNRGDGKDFVWPVESVIRIQTGERDEAAL